MAEPAVTIDTLTVVLGKDFIALQDINLELPKGKITGFIGPSGAGKTTLIRSIVGRQRLSSGMVTVLGQAAGSARLRPRLSYMTQNVSVYPDLTVQQNIRYFARMYGSKPRKIRPLTAELLQLVDLEAQASQLVGKLSGGQKQRVSLAIALIGYPELMVLDEPTIGLDPLLREQIWRLFRQLSGKGTTLIISSHVMEEAERCDDLVLVREGRVLAHDTPQALCAKTGTKTVEQSFLKLVGKTA